MRCIFLFNEKKEMVKMWEIVGLVGVVILVLAIEYKYNEGVKEMKNDIDIQKLKTVASYNRCFTEFYEEFFKELQKYRKNYKEIFTIGVVESSLNKYALGDSNYSIGYFQISTWRGEHDDKNSTVDILLNRLVDSIMFTKEQRTQEILKSRKGDKTSKLFYTYVQFAMVNEYIEMAKSELRLAGIEYKPEYLAFLYNAGLGNLKGEKGEYITKEEFEERLNIWKGRYNYYQKFNRVYNMI